MCYILFRFSPFFRIKHINLGQCSELLYNELYRHMSRAYSILNTIQIWMDLWHSQPWPTHLVFKKLPDLINVNLNTILSKTKLKPATAWQDMSTSTVTTKETDVILKECLVKAKECSMVLLVLLKRNSTNCHIKFKKLKTLTYLQDFWSYHQKRTDHPKPT